ncbi:ATPase domain-containing protein [Methanococcoides sp. NM1]|uniref:RAD55 family ATPase n=1 Tax=Methanococcoides sp. NM1 TaxID=1201013 RepID=UPI0010838674|nr:ATPase domain-containing protein [Methanococcoides sp. NM1]
MSSQLSVGTEVIITPRVSQRKRAAEQELSLAEETQVQRKLELRAVPQDIVPVIETNDFRETVVSSEIMETMSSVVSRDTNEVKSIPKNVYNGPVVVPTGIYVLDRTLGGGLPLNSMVYFSADPRSMSEVFFYEFTQSRKTYYFTTGRRPKYVRSDIMNQNLDPSNVIFVDIYSEYYFTSMGDMVDHLGNGHIDSKIIEYAEYNLRTILNDSQGEEINIIFDNFSFFMNLNVNPGLLKRLINLLYETTKEANSITFLYSLKGSHDERAENEILNASDVIFDVDVERHPDKILSKLSIPKIRGMAPKTDVIKFNVSEGINIDTSKDIA